MSATLPVKVDHVEFDRLMGHYDKAMERLESKYKNVSTNGDYRESRANEPHWTEKHYGDDPVVESVVSQFRERSKKGMRKYGVPMSRDDYELREWLVHAREEAMDLVNYLEAGIQKIDRKLKK